MKLFSIGIFPTRRGFFLYRALPFLLVLFLAVSGAQPVLAASAQDYESLRLITEAFNEISQKFVWKKSEEEIVYGSLRGLMNSLDPDSSFLTPQEYKKVLSGQKAPAAEAGLDLIYKDNLLTVVSVMDNGPAWRAGLRPGDHILKVDGHLVRNLTTQEATRRFQGKPGTSFKLQVLRNGLVKPLNLTLTLEPLAPGQVTSKIIKDSYAYIRIPYFTPETPGELLSALKNLKLHHPPLKGLVLDLRNNARGTLELAVRAASPFLGNREVVTTKGRPPEPNQVYKGRGRDELSNFHLPMVVLVDGGTARGAEILAGALRDQFGAVLLGAKTVGLCGVTKILPLRDGSALMMTVAQCYTPKGQKIPGKGLKPEVEGKKPKAVAGVTPPAKLPPDNDPWVIQALEILQHKKTQKLAKKVVKP
ncbi:MAG: S41 family peptidase [Syntrophales bacterium]|nr:S41 family peptidase [Syntrophales bacterium]MDD5642654.1 S41 family peptidase [Syntrophales bacterium]